MDGRLTKNLRLAITLTMLMMIKRSDRQIPAVCSRRNVIYSRVVQGWLFRTIITGINILVANKTAVSFFLVCKTFSMRYDVGHPISTDSGLISQKLLSKSELYSHYI